MINIEIRTIEERRTVQRLIDRTIDAKGVDDGRIRMLLAAAAAWDAKVRASPRESESKLQENGYVREL